MGQQPIGVYTIACKPTQPLLDGYGNPVLDGYGNWIPSDQGVYNIPPTPVLDGYGRPVLDGYGRPVIAVTVQEGYGLWGVLLAPGTGRSLVNFTMPPSFGIWINPFGGLCTPGGGNCEFFAPNSYFEEFGPAANNGITYFTTIPGLLIVVQVQ